MTKSVILLIAMQISQMDLTIKQKQELSGCVFYGQQKAESPDFALRLRYCKLKQRINIGSK